MNGQPCLIKDYIDEYLKGFKLGYDAILKSKAEFAGFIDNLESKQIETRIIYRPNKNIRYHT